MQAKFYLYTKTVYMYICWLPPKVQKGVAFPSSNSVLSKLNVISYTGFKMNSKHLVWIFRPFLSRLFFSRLKRKPAMLLISATLHQDQHIHCNTEVTIYGWLLIFKEKLELFCFPLNVCFVIIHVYIWAHVYIWLLFICFTLPSTLITTNFFPGGKFYFLTTETITVSL